ncbi:tail protein [Pseudomonas phage WP1]
MKSVGVEQPVGQGGRAENSEPALLHRDPERIGVAATGGAAVVSGNCLAATNRNAEVVRVGNDGMTRRYRSMVNASASDPLSRMTWEEQPAWSAMRSSIPMPAGGPGRSSGGEVITTGRSFSDLLNGTWEFFSDSVVIASQNAPVYPASAGAAAGMLEAKSWVSGASTFCVQRYIDRVGNVAVRGLNAGAWTSWMYAVNVIALQQVGSPMESRPDRRTLTR